MKSIMMISEIFSLFFRCMENFRSSKLERRVEFANEDHWGVWWTKNRKTIEKLFEVQNLYKLTSNFSGITGSFRWTGFQQ